MIYADRKIEGKLKKFTTSNMHIVCDFDLTLSKKGSMSSFNFISNNIGNSFLEEVEKLFAYYHPMELDEQIPFAKKYLLMKEWWSKEFELYSSFGLQESDLNKMLQDTTSIQLRDGVKEFFMSARKLKIPIIIFSSGVGNVIEKILIDNDCKLENVFLISNFVQFENGVATGLRNFVIHGLNKNEKSLPNKIYEMVAKRPKVLLFGDTIGDTYMSISDKQDSIKVGFLEEKEERIEIFKDAFDIVCTNNTSFTQLNQNFNFLDNIAKNTTKQTPKAK